MYANNKTKEYIEQHTNIKRKRIDKYINIYKQGKDKLYKDFHGKKLNTVDICMLYGLINQKN